MVLIHALFRPQFTGLIKAHKFLYNIYRNKREHGACSCFLLAPVQLSIVVSNSSESYLRLRKSKKGRALEK